MTYFSPSSSARHGGPTGGDEGNDPRRIGIQPAGEPRARMRQPNPSDRPAASGDATQVPPPYASRGSEHDVPAEPPGREPFAGAAPDVPESFRRDDPPGDLAGLFPAREEPRTEPTPPAMIDLTRHERSAPGPAGQPQQAVERPVPPGFPVELPQPSLRREQLLLTAVSWLIVLFTTLLGALGGLTYASVKTPTYTATSSVVLGPVPGTAGTQVGAAGFANAYAQVATQSTVLQPALVDAGISMSVDEARRHLQVSVPDGSPLIVVDATAGSGADAAALANAAASGIAAYATGYEAKTGYRAAQFTTASAPASGSTPHRALSVLIGALIGLCVGIGVVQLVRRSRRTSAGSDG